MGKLVGLDISGNNELKDIEISDNPDLLIISTSRIKITSIDITNTKQLNNAEWVSYIHPCKFQQCFKQKAYYLYGRTYYT